MRGKLLCNGNVAILGTGIMMVDEVEMGADSTLSLQTNTDIYEDGTGSVAFFLKTGEKEYTLANGDIGVTGILDEQYTVKGVKLIVPSQLLFWRYFRGWGIHSGSRRRTDREHVQPHDL